MCAPIVSPSFKVPLTHCEPGFLITILSEKYAALDYDAIIESKPRLGNVFSGIWPEDVINREINLEHINAHYQDYQNRCGYTYTVLSLDYLKCLGCIYIYPSLKAGFDIMVHYWVHISLMDTEFEARFTTFIQGWLNVVWPFKSVAYPGRLLSWEDWLALPDSEVLYHY